MNGTSVRVEPAARQEKEVWTMLEAGTLLRNRYQIEEALSQTGHPVYRALDTHINQTVALKGWHDLDNSQRAALERAARDLSMLRHPSLADVRDVFTEGDSVYAVMEHVPGESLEEVLLRAAEMGEGLPVDRVMGWADQILDALSYLHARQPPIVHGDVKPRNIRLASQDRAVLADVEARPPGGGAVAQSQLPTPYLAPEQWMTGQPGVRSDLYGLAATLYHLLSGSEPPGAQERSNALREGGEDPLQPLALLNPRVPAALSAVLARALALDPAQRPTSAAALRADLRSARYAPLPTEAGAAVVETPIAEETPLSPDMTLLEARTGETFSGAPFDTAPADTPPPPVNEGRGRNRTCLWLGIGGAALALLSLCICFVIFSAIAPDVTEQFEEVLETLSTPTPGGATSEDIEGATTISVFDLEVGDCFDDPLDGLELIDELTVLPCSAPHDNEVFELLQYPGDGPFPAEDEMETFSDEQCVAAFGEYVGIAYEESELFYWTIKPTAETWEDGDREIVCALYAVDENGDFAKLEGSMQGSGR